MDKNFNEKADLLSMEELERVSGGTMKQTALDTEFLHALGLNIKSRTSKYVHQYFKEVSRELISSWLEVGVFCKEITTSDYGKNVYTDLEGNVITRKEAMQIAMKARGVALNTATYGE